MPRNVAAAFILAACLALGGPLGAEEPPPAASLARLRIELTARDASGATIAGALLLRPASGAAAAVRLTVSELSPIVAALPAGSAWKLGAEIPGFWAPGKLVALGAAGTETVEHLALWRLGTIAGTVKMAGKDVPMPKRIVAALVAAPKPGTVPALPDERLTCPVSAAGAFQCELPAGTHDVALSADGLIPVYRWGIQVPPGKTASVGAIELKVGASVAAWVAAEDGRVSPESAVARLLPMQAGGTDPAQMQHLASSAIYSRVGKDGFVQLTGVAPGNYVLQVEQPGYAPARVQPIEVWRGAETLVQPPILLRRPLRFELTVSPPVDWLGKPWRAELSRASDLGGVLESAYEGPVGGDGRLDVPGQSPGRYWLDVKDSLGNSMYAEPELAITGAADAKRDVRIDLVTVKGEVLLGKEPLAATLWFGGRFSNPGVKMESDAEGRFHGVLPKGGKWRVEIGADHPALKAMRLLQVSPDHSGRATFDIKLPDTHLFGRVVDEDDSPVKGARVGLSSGLLVSIRLETNERGEFETRGLDEGLTYLTAEASTREGKLTSDVATATVTEGRDVGPVEIRVRRMKTLAGQVVSAQGPVAGAVVDAAPRRPDYLHTESTQTDLDGSFKAAVPSKAERVLLVVSPPGHGLKVFDVPADGLAKTLPVAEETGTIQVAVPYTRDEFEDQRMTFWLLQDGLPIPWATLHRWASGHGTSFSDGGFTRIELPAMAPGEYEACFVAISVSIAESLAGWPPPASGCAAGTLSPGSTLKLAPKRG